MVGDWRKELELRFTKKLRRQIVQDFCERHAGTWDATAFLDEVIAKGENHPAFHWFEWDQNKAAREFQLIQARNFANDLVITFTIETTERRGIVVKETTMPLVISPTSGWRAGGGYYLADPNDPDKMAQYCAEAATALKTWLSRYGAAVLYGGGKVEPFEKVIEHLENIQLESPAPDLIPAE